MRFNLVGHIRVQYPGALLCAAVELVLLFYFVQLLPVALCPRERDERTGLHESAFLVQAVGRGGAACGSYVRSYCDNAEFGFVCQMSARGDFVVDVFADHESWCGSLWVSKDVSTCQFTTKEAKYTFSASDSSS